MNTNTATLPITILPELEDFLPPLSPEEKSELRLSIENDGVRDNLLVWHTVNEHGEEVRILIDGHNRYRTTESLGRDVAGLPTADIDFSSMEEAKAWIIANQLMRRNLSDAQRRHFRGLAYEAAKGKHGGDHGNQHTKLPKGQSDLLPNTEQTGNSCDSASTAKKLAEQFGVSEKTIKRDAVFAKAVEALPADEKAAVLSGKKKLPVVAKAAKPANPSGVTPKPIQAVDPLPAVASSHIPLTVDSILTIPLSNPLDCLTLIERSFDRASEYLRSLGSIREADREAFLDGCVELSNLMHSLSAQCGNMDREADDAEHEDNETASYEDGNEPVEPPFIPETPDGESKIETFGELDKCRNVAIFTVIKGSSVGKTMRVGRRAHFTIGTDESTGWGLTGEGIAPHHVIINRGDDDRDIDGNIDDDSFVYIESEDTDWTGLITFKAGLYKIGDNLIRVAYNPAS